MRKDVIEKTGSLPYLDIKNVLASEPEKLDFVLPGLLAGTVGAIVSPGGVGKSAYVLAKMKEISQQGRAVYLSLEDNLEMLKHRMHALHYSSTDEEKALIEDPSRFFIAPLEDRAVKIENDDWFSMIKEIATNSRAIFIDTLRKFHNSNENDSSEMTLITDRLSQIAVASNCCPIYIHHTSKSGQGGSQQASRGSSVLVDNIKWQQYLEAMTEAEAKVFGIKNMKHYFKVGTSKINAGIQPDPTWYKRVSDPRPNFDGYYAQEVSFNKEVEANNNKDGEYRI
ncbi:helicase RepA family protein [Billgrantia endophytica]|uniref:Uncharacterized protein n=1 Tax=Billgrantia endophytica TaxID=2033802 RepID=A0A2N7TUB0_9GAMM|nr:helicase RepA family protein [Halomonas endophytica]PMR71775.1 hypothetical protein C1H69_22850 [Halomonas endophytica]